MRREKLTKFGDYERKARFHALGFVVYVVFTEDMERSVTPRYAQITPKPSVQAMHVREEGLPYSHLFFKIGNCTNGVIAHEAWHAIRYLLEDWTECGLGNETVAYHLGYLVDIATMFRNDLIDQGVGVKSKTQEVPDERNTSQGTVGKVQGMPSRFDNEGQEGEVPSEANLDERDPGRCCP